MNKLSKSQKGFTVVEGLLIVLILVIMGDIGYTVYHNDHPKNVAASVKATSATQPTTTNSEPVSSTQYLKITQLGIELPLSSAISELSYSWDSTNSEANIGSAPLLSYAETQDPGECTPTGSDGSAAAATYPLGSISGSVVPAGYAGNYKSYTVDGNAYTLYLPRNGCATSDSSGANNVVNESGLYENAVEDALQSAKTY